MAGSVPPPAAPAAAAPLINARRELWVVVTMLRKRSSLELIEKVQRCRCRLEVGTMGNRDFDVRDRRRTYDVFVSQRLAADCHARDALASCLRYKPRLG